MSVVKRRELNLALFSSDFQCLGLSADLILSEKHVKPTLSIKLRQLSPWASINVMNCNYISFSFLLSCLFK